MNMFVTAVSSLGFVSAQPPLTPPAYQSTEITLIAVCPPEAKQKCRTEADRRMKGANAAYCTTDGVNNCKEDIMDGAARCLDACGDTGAFDRLQNIQSRHTDCTVNDCSKSP